MYGQAALAGCGVNRITSVATAAMAMLIHVMDRNRSRLPCSIAFQLAWSRAAKRTRPPVKLSMRIPGWKGCGNLCSQRKSTINRREVSADSEMSLRVRLPAYDRSRGNRRRAKKDIDL